MSDDLLVRLTLVADALNDAGNFDGEECVLEAVKAIQAAADNPSKIEVYEGTLVYEAGDLSFRWRGGEYVEVRRTDISLDDPPFDALNVWDHDFDAPRCQTVQEFIDECVAYLDVPD